MPQRGQNTRKRINFKLIIAIHTPDILLTKIIANKLMHQLDEYQPSAQAGFCRGYSTVEHIQSYMLTDRKLH